MGDGYRSEIIGSLLRPDYVAQAMADAEAGVIEPEELAAVQDRAVNEAIALQEDCGIDVLTDGEMRRVLWSDPLTESLAGFGTDERAPVPFTAGEDREDAAVRLPPAVVGRLGPSTNLPLREVQYARRHTDRPVKATMPGLTYASVLWVPGVSDGPYPDRDEYIRDAVALVRDLVGELVDAGVEYVQFDSPRYTHMVSEEGRANLERLGLDTHTWLSEMIALDNEVIDAFPEVTFGLHLCRGNHRSMWSVEGGYDAIAEQLFGEIHCQRLLLEYDTPRAGTFSPLRFVPEDKTVVLGLITTKEPELESAELLRDRIEEASGYIPLDRLALSPQCGFASVIEGNRISPEAQRAKLERLGEVARSVWG